MIDIRAIRADPDLFDAALARRGLEPTATRLLALDSARRTAIERLENLQAARNAASEQASKFWTAVKQIGTASKQARKARTAIKQLKTASEQVSKARAAIEQFENLRVERNAALKQANKAPTAIKQIANLKAVYSAISKQTRKARDAIKHIKATIEQANKAQATIKQIVATFEQANKARDAIKQIVVTLEQASKTWDAIKQLKNLPTVRNATFERTNKARIAIKRIETTIKQASKAGDAIKQLETASEQASKAQTAIKQIETTIKQASEAGATIKRIETTIKQASKAGDAIKQLETASGQASKAQAAIEQLETASQQAIKAGDAKMMEAFTLFRAEMAHSRHRLSELQQAARERSADLAAELELLPNLPLAGVPDGVDESANLELRRNGMIPERGYPPREHFVLGEALGLMDFKTAARLSGSRFVVLRGALARLHQSLGRFMLDRHVEENGYEEIWVPALVLPEVLRGTGQLPKFHDDLYQTTREHWLIPTAEVPLTNLVSGQVLDSGQLPQRYVAWTPCFRSEAGAAGQDTRGMLRQHQFEKVELVSITRPEDSAGELERMTGCAEGVLEALGLPWRTVALCTGDLGFAAGMTYDIETWLPGQGRYREISSCSTCGDFQARRMDARFRPAGGGKPEFVHTLNGSGVAIGRALIAVMENGQTEDGGIDLPPVLAPYMGGARRIDPDGSLAGKA